MTTGHWTPTAGMLMAMGMLTGTATEAGNTGTPWIDRRAANQERRIDAGAASGQLTGSEADRLDERLDRIEAREDRVKADGVVTPRERARLHHDLNGSGRAIWRQKHDRQHR
jgi:uncharacterized membrane protein YebE (DUF533 family)